MTLRTRYNYYADTARVARDDKIRNAIGARGPRWHGMTIPEIIAVLSLEWPDVLFTENEKRKSIRWRDKPVDDETNVIRPQFPRRT